MTITSSGYTRDLKLRNDVGNIDADGDGTAFSAEDFKFDDQNIKTILNNVTDYDGASKDNLKDTIAKILGFTGYTDATAADKQTIDLIVEEVLGITESNSMDDLRVAIFIVLERYDSDTMNYENITDITRDSDSDTIGDGLKNITSDLLFKDLGGTDTTNIPVQNVKDFFTELATHLGATSSSSPTSSSYSSLVTSIIGSDTEVTEAKLTEIMAFFKGYAENNSIPQDTLFTSITAATKDTTTGVYTYDADNDTNTSNSTCELDGTTWTYIAATPSTPSTPTPGDTFDIDTEFATADTAKKTINGIEYTGLDDNQISYADAVKLVRESKGQDATAAVTQVDIDNFIAKSNSINGTASLEEVKAVINDAGTSTAMADAVSTMKTDLGIDSTVTMYDNLLQNILTNGVEDFDESKLSDADYIKATTDVAWQILDSLKKGTDLTDSDTSTDGIQVASTHVTDYTYTFDPTTLSFDDGWTYMQDSDYNLANLKPNNPTETTSTST